MLFQQSGKGSLSLFYNVMRGMSPANTHRIKRVWEKELSVNIDEETWEDIWSYAKKISICTQTKAIQYPIHISPKRRHFFDSSFLLYVSNVKQKEAPYLTACGHVTNDENIGLIYFVKCRRYLADI